MTTYHNVRSCCNHGTGNWNRRRILSCEAPEILSVWYDDTFGVSRAPRDYSTAPWMQQAGATVFAPFPSETSYFGNPSQAWMINFRVANLDRMIAQLRARGIEVVLDPEIYPNGRFAHLSDPEGNRIELWEPKGDS